MGLYSCACYEIGRILYGCVPLFIYILVLVLDGMEEHLHDPDTHTCSHRTMTTDCPACNSFATTLARRPRRWSRPSITTVDSNMVIK